MNGGEEEAGTLCAAVFAVRGWFTLQLLHSSGLGREGSTLLGPESSGPCLESCRSPSPGSCEEYLAQLSPGPEGRVARENEV